MTINEKVKGLFDSTIEFLIENESISPLAIGSIKLLRPKIFKKIDKKVFTKEEIINIINKIK